MLLICNQETQKRKFFLRHKYCWRTARFLLGKWDLHHWNFFWTSQISFRISPGSFFGTGRWVRDLSSFCQGHNGFHCILHHILYFMYFYNTVSSIQLRRFLPLQLWQLSYGGCALTPDPGVLHFRRSTTFLWVYYHYWITAKLWLTHGHGMAE